MFLMGAAVVLIASVHLLIRAVFVLLGLAQGEELVSILIVVS
jgi:hypothetical protein